MRRKVIRTLLCSVVYDCAEWYAHMHMWALLLNLTDGLVIISLPCGFYLSSSSSLWPPCLADADITFLPCDFYLLFYPSPNLRGRRLELPYFDTWCGLSANLECMSEMCCMRLAGNTGRKKSPSAHHRTILSGYIFATKARIDTRKKC